MQRAARRWSLSGCWTPACCMPVSSRSWVERLARKPDRRARRRDSTLSGRCPIRLSQRGGWSFLKETWRSEEHTSELQSQSNLVCRLLLEKKKEQLCQSVVREISKR